MKNFNILQIIFFFFLTMSLPLFAKESKKNAGMEAIQNYFTQVESLKKEEKWEEIISLGEKAFSYAEQENVITNEQKFELVDQLASTYFRLGLFAQGKEKAKALLSLGNTILQDEFLVNSLYKFSAIARGEANITKNKQQQKELFAQAREFAQRALEICEISCANNAPLKAKVSFNAGAAIADDPEGDYAKAVPIYQEAIKIFTDANLNDYRQRTLIRLGKLYLLLKNFDKSLEILEKLKSEDFEIRTKMHFEYSQAQVLFAKDRHEEALKIAQKGLKTAKKLLAKVDISRFHQLITNIENASQKDK